MSLPIDSSVVCQIPDCTTTRTEIEQELKTFLSSYCTFCKQDRNGKLCGCAFPCTLTFRAQMLNKIHEILGVEKQPNKKAIQVCFKHPDLLKQARELCIAKRRELSTAARARKFDRAAPKTNQTVQANVPSAGVVLEVGTAEQPISAGNLTQEALALSDTSLDSNDDELVKFEDFARRKFAEIDRKAKEEIDRLALEEKSTAKMTKILFNLGNDQTDSSSGEESNFMSHVLTPKKKIPRNLSLDLESQGGCGTSEVELCKDLSDDETREKVETRKRKKRGKRPKKKTLSIVYKDYFSKVLAREMSCLMHKSYLNDVDVVCKDGHVSTSSIMLAAASTFLRDVFVDIPAVDRNKVMLVPDLSVSEVETFLEVLFADESKLVSLSHNQVKKLENFCSLFKIESTLVERKRKPGRPRGSVNKKTRMIVDVKVPEKISPRVIDHHSPVEETPTSETAINREYHSCPSQASVELCLESPLRQIATLENSSPAVPGEMPTNVGDNFLESVQLSTADREVNIARVHEGNLSKPNDDL